MFFFFLSLFLSFFLLPTFPCLNLCGGAQPGVRESWLGKHHPNVQSSPNGVSISHWGVVEWGMGWMDGYYASAAAREISLPYVP